MSDRNTILERLRDVHSFPGEYIFKVIGENSDVFVTRVVQATINVLGSGAQPDISTRESSGGKHLSVTLTVNVDTAEAILDVYEVIQQIDGVRFLL